MGPVELSRSTTSACQQLTGLIGTQALSGVQCTCFWHNPHGRKQSGGFPRSSPSPVIPLALDHRAGATFPLVRACAEFAFLSTRGPGGA